MGSSNSITTTEPVAGAGQTSPPALSPRQRALAGERRTWLVEAQPHLAAGLSVSAVSRLLGLKGPALHRLLNLAPGGSPATRGEYLLAQPLESLAPEVPAGRTSDFEALLTGKPVRDELFRLYSLTLGACSASSAHSRRTGSMALTLERFADSQLCPGHLGAKLRAGSQPAPLLRLLRTFTAELEQKVRGEGHYQLASFVGRRSQDIELENGELVAAQPGKLWVFDDMSTNLPFWFELPPDVATAAAHQKLAARHGCAVGRQGLYAATWTPSGLCWLGVELLGRVRDAYTSDIILRFFRRLMQTYGKPDVIVLEQGVWKARNINGQSPRPQTQDPIPSEGLTDTDRHYLQDGLRGLGTRLIYVFSPRGPLKAQLECGFNYLQRVTPTLLSESEGVNIGRYGGEFEHAAQQMRRAHDGVAHPRDLGFLHLERCADATWSAMQWISERNRAAASFASSTPRARLTADELAIFLPEYRELQINGGHVWPTVNGLELSFIQPELFAALGNGARVGVKFDPAEPTLGAAIYELGTGQFLGWAAHHGAGPLLSYRADRSDEGLQLLKRYRAAHRTAYRAFDLPSRRTIRIAEARDGQGNVATVAQGQTPQTPDPRSQTHRTHRSILTAPTTDEFARKRQRLMESAAAVRELQEQ